MPSQVVSIDAPIEGWDAFHSIDQMPPTAAILLDNWIPRGGSCDSRGGHSVFVDLGTGVPCETVASLENESESQLLAASDGGLWDITDGTATQIAAASTYSLDRWQCENFRKADESGILIMCNGLDNTQIYNGTTIRDIITTGTDEALSLTPTFVGCVVYKGRAYYWLPDDNAFYYTQAGSYEGTFQKFDLGTFTRRGGVLVSIFTWTQQDAGHGRDDFIVFVFSTGEILVYQGDDPESTGYWEQIGRYYTSAPMSIRGVVQYGADSILMTRDGYVSMASIMQQGRTSDVPAFSRLIAPAIQERANRTNTLFGWDCQLFQKQSLILFNVPTSDTTFEQHVMDTVTERWCRFTTLNVNCLKVYDERLFGGTSDGKVLAMLEGTSDNGSAIPLDALYAFTDMGNGGVRKHVTAAQVISTTSNPGKTSISAHADYKVPTLTPLVVSETALTDGVWSIPPASPPSAVGSYWDSEYWASESSQAKTTMGWQNVSGYGFSVALLVRMAKLNEAVTWRSTSLRYHMTGAN